MFERPKAGETAVLVHLDFSGSSLQASRQEFRELVTSAGAKPVATITGMRQVPDAKYFVGSGKVQEIRAVVLLESAELVIFNHALSPAQSRNLEKVLKCRVLDRTGLILDIFAQRARTFEGKLQVELAQLKYLSTRLIRGWTHLERQKGGIGLRGPGETQLETDRRLIRNRIKTINRRLEKVRKQRDQGRQSRRQALLPTVSLVGYTNAGKSSLFNRLTGADAYAAGKLFATLDPLLRRIELPTAGPAVVADTVGFIHDLPHDLIEAFRATLEETRDANLLLHVIDVHDENKDANISQVEQVLEQIAADQVPQLRVYNKIDKLEGCQPRVELGADGKPQGVWISSLNGEGLDLLQQAIVAHLYGDPICRSLCLQPSQGKLRAELYAQGTVLSERVDEHGNWWLSVSMPRSLYERLFPSKESESQNDILSHPSFESKDEDVQDDTPGSKRIGGTGS